MGQTSQWGCSAGTVEAAELGRLPMAPGLKWGCGVPQWTTGPEGSPWAEMIPVMWVAGMGPFWQDRLRAATRAFLANTKSSCCQVGRTAVPSLLTPSATSTPGPSRSMLANTLSNSSCSDPSKPPITCCSLSKVSRG